MLYTSTRPHDEPITAKLPQEVMATACEQRYRGMSTCLTSGLPDPLYWYPYSWYRCTPRNNSKSCLSVSSVSTHYFASVCVCVSYRGDSILATDVRPQAVTSHCAPLVVPGGGRHAAVMARHDTVPVGLTSRGCREQHSQCACVHMCACGRACACIHGVPPDEKLTMAGRRSCS